MGIRTGRKDSFVKNISSKIANGFRRMMTHDGVQDTGCPLKVMHTDYAKRIPFFTGMHRFLPALTQLFGEKAIGIPVRHKERAHGSSKFSFKNRALPGLCDLLAFIWMRRRFVDPRVAQDNLQTQETTLR